MYKGKTKINPPGINLFDFNFILRPWEENMNPIMEKYLSIENSMMEI